MLCDYLPDNPGQYHADKFYQVSTTDKEAILKVAQDEHVDYIIAYASDPAAPTAAYVAENLVFLRIRIKQLKRFAIRICSVDSLLNMGSIRPEQPDSRVRMMQKLI